jgi:uncharacterized GH25 family protein
MFTSKLCTIAASVGLFVIAGTTANAHDLVLIPAADGRVTVRYGHPGDWQPIDDGKVVDIATIAPDGVRSELRGQLAKRGLDRIASSALTHRKPGQAFMIAGRYDNGLWSHMPARGDAKGKVINASRLMLPDAEFISTNLKYGKGVFLVANDSTVYKLRVGHLLELIPQVNPATLGPDDKLPVLLLLDGKPLQGAGIENSNGLNQGAEDKVPRYETDAHGIAQVPLRPRGINTLAVDVERPNDGSLGAYAKALGADRFVLIATYTFVR